MLFSIVTSLLLIVVKVCVKGESRDGDALTFQDPLMCNLSLNETFSTTTLGCTKCQWKQDYKDCPCPNGHRQPSASEMLTNGYDKCIRCSDNQTVYDQLYCLGCGVDNPYDSATGKCKPCPHGYIEVTYEFDGKPKDKVECQKCADGFTPDVSGTVCRLCHPSFVTNSAGICKCPELSHNLINGICFTSAEVLDPNVKNIDTKQVSRIEYDEGIKFESPLFRDNAIAAFYLCKVKHNETACQMLTNLCTLNLHSYNDDWTVCRLYRSVFSTPVSHPPEYVPKLYYSDTEAPTILIMASAIPHHYDTEFTRHTSDINITVSRVSFDGKFLGLASLNEIIPCTEQQTIQRISQKFGSTYKTTCSLPIQDLWNSYKEKMEFLDPYVSYQNEKSGKIHLYSAPVKILNFKKNGFNSNTNTMEDKYPQWQLVRRFFIVDTIGGFGTDKDDNALGTPNMVRYVEDMSIRIQLQNDKEPGKIYVPLITLTYKQVNKDSFLRNENVDFTYSVNYVMDMSRSIEDVKISVGVISAFAVIWAALQTWSFNRRNGRGEIDIETIANLLITSCGHLADAFFIVCFSTALYWLIFFKKQVAVHVLLPQPDQEKLIRDLLISAFSLKIVDIIKLVMRQVNVDIFFVDWERPRARNTIQPPNEAGRNDSKSDTNNDNKSSDGSVSIWRTYFIANEWNEIQSTRKIHIATQIILSIFFLEILGFKYWGLNWPDGSLNPGPEAKNIPYCTSARFAVGSFVFGLVGICQWLYHIGFHSRFVTNKVQDFVDVCTLANISVFILAAKQQGYYIHGRSVHGFADTDMQTMIEQLNREEEDLCGRRGLLPSTDQQTFLISVPNTFRSVYNQVLQPLYASSNVNAALVGKGRLMNTGTGSKVALGSKPSANMINLSIHAYHSMNRFLTAFLEHALSDLDYDVTDKSFFESTFDMEFSEVGNDRAVFYTDNGHSFDSVLFYGNERTLFMFNLYTFIFVDILSHNFVLAGVITFISDMILKWTRNFLGRRNLARKTLIDSRFLI